MAPVVELVQARKQYDTVTALDGISLAVPAGQVLAVLGPNGAGKTTAIGLMLGLRRPTSGGARLFGLDPRDMVARARCGAMLQESGVPAVLTVAELIDLFRSYYPRPLPTDRVVRVAGLEGLARQLAGRLSGGQRQRLYFALAICGDPEVLFLDEPSVGLDFDARRAFWEHMRAFARAGRTIVLTTHYMDEADALADRIVLIDRGRVVADASPAVLKARVAGKRISFQADGALSATVLADLPVQRAASANGRHQIFSADPEAVLAALFARGVAIRDLEVVGASLEEAIQRVSSDDG
jgi:ABC-2 type transport system ATP-binding protein